MKFFKVLRFYPHVKSNRSSEPWHFVSNMLQLARTRAKFNSKKSLIFTKVEGFNLKRHIGSATYNYIHGRWPTRIHNYRVKSTPKLTEASFIRTINETRIAAFYPYTNNRSWDSKLIWNSFFRTHNNTN